MTKVDSLELTAWTLAARHDDIPLTVFRMDAKSYGTLVDWTRARTGREDSPAVAVLRGLHEIVSLFVPDTIYVTIGRGAGLSITFTGHVARDEDRRRRLRLALATWLGTLYPERTPQQRADVADAALRDGNWEMTEVPMGLRGRGIFACDAPTDNLLWDALMAQAVRALAGREVIFESGRAKRLVPTVPTAGPFDGIELVAFPPNASPRRSGGYWTEVVTICSASFPERDGIHLLAHMSIRNWGEVRSPTSGRTHRSLDVFLPQVPDLDDLGPQRHGAFALKVVGGGTPGDRSWIGRWQHKDNENVFGVLARLTGMADLPVEGSLKPHVPGDGTWMLPRLGTVHGDKFLPGGTGLPMPDERALAVAVGRAIEPLGLERLPPVHRRTVRGARPETPFESGPDDADFTARRSAVVRALRVVNDIPEDRPAVLNVFLFAVRDEAAANLRAAAMAVLGEAEVDGDSIRWPDGLELRLRQHAAGPLAEALFLFPEPSEDDLARFPTEPMWKAERKRRQTEANGAARAAMERWVRQCRGTISGVCCAVLEIPEEFRDKYHDPYMMARQVLGGARVLPQVCLAKAAADGQTDDVEHRFVAAFSDLIRTLGVVPMGARSRHDVAALTVAQVNSSIRAGSQIQTQAVPLAAQVRRGVLFAALPGRDGLPDWRPYPEVYLAMTSGQHERFGRTRNVESQTKFAAFWRQALQDVCNSGGGLVLIDAVTGRQRLGGMANGNLAFDRLEIGGGNMPILPSDLPGVTLARVTHQDAKLPSYFHAEDAGWVSGIFAWEGSARTAFGLKQKPATHTKPKAIVTTSRHPGPDDNPKGVREDADRKYAAIDETCAFFLQPGDDPGAVIQRVQGLRGAHAQYGRPDLAALSAARAVPAEERDHGVTVDCLHFPQSRAGGTALLAANHVDDENSQPAALKGQKGRHASSMNRRWRRFRLPPDKVQFA